MNLTTLRPGHTPQEWDAYLSLFSPPNPKREGNDILINAMIRSVMIPELRVELQVALTESISEAASDVPAKGVRTCASSHDVHASDCAAIPPRPIGITNNGGPGPRCLSRAVVPTKTADHIGSQVVSKRRAHHWI